MATATKENNKSLLTDAFDALLEKFGPRKTTQLWQILAMPRGDYVKTRRKLFAGKDVTTMYREAKKFNRK
ncbi:MAG TPA: hypothetical protein VGA53_00375 [Candidatus Paceibacterota bacterium]